MSITQAEHLAAELAAIELSAAEKTAALLANQDTFLLAHDLAELLKANGAPFETKPSVIYLSCDRPYFMIYAHHGGEESESVLAAIQDTRLPYRVVDGYNGSVRSVRVEGFDGIEVVLPADFFPFGAGPALQQGVRP